MGTAPLGIASTSAFSLLNLPSALASRRAASMRSLKILIPSPSGSSVLASTDARTLGGLAQGVAAHELVEVAPLTAAPLLLIDEGEVLLLELLEKLPPAALLKR